jgi:pimeloyl-ACP methyl ester carboxylesterase
MNQWRAQIEFFQNKNPCLLLDYRGHHKSEYPQDARSMNLSALAKDAAAVVKAKIPEGKNVHVWGHSMGCSVALELALAEPELCRSLVLCCGSVENPFRRMFGMSVLEHVMQYLLGLFHNNKEIFYKAWNILMSKPDFARYVVMFAGFNRQAVESDDIDTYVKAVASIAPKAFFPLMIEMTKGHTHNILPKISTQSLVVAGASDYVTPPANQQALARDLLNAEYFQIPAGSHNVQLDFGEYVCLKAQEFWKKHDLL